MVTAGRRFKLRAVNHVCLLVDDLDAAMAAYWRDLGVGPWRIVTRDITTTREIFYHGELAPDARWLVATAQVGEMIIELTQYVSGTTIYPDFKERAEYGVHHIGSIVESLDEATAQMAEAGYPVIAGGKGLGPRGDGAFAFFDTEQELGVLYELYEPPSEWLPAERTFPEEA